MFELQKLMFMGKDVQPPSLDFFSGTNIIYGASNTGKSFAFKCIDYMLGGDKKLPPIKEIAEYDSILLGFSVKGKGDFVLQRGTAKGNYTIFGGNISQRETYKNSNELLAKKSKGKKLSLSEFLLGELRLSDIVIAEKTNGQKRTISFRDIIHLSSADETSIQEERSPIETGRDTAITPDRSAFRYFINGDDDSDLEEIEDGKTVRISKDAKLSILNEILDDVNKQLSPYIHEDEVKANLKEKDNELENIRKEFKNYKKEIQNLYEEKRKLLISDSEISKRQGTLSSYIERFSNLNRVYISDIERLSSIEESGFLFSIQKRSLCQLCGALPEHQTVDNHLESINNAKKSAISEIFKIKKLQEELFITLDNVKVEEEKNNDIILSLKSKISALDKSIDELLPRISKIEEHITAIIKSRDIILSVLDLFRQKKNLHLKIAQTNAIKQPSKKDYPPLQLSDFKTKKFCNHISAVLKAWEFPGANNITFDEKTYDIVIDGTHRIANGKGVRAITHAAFKIALLTYCHEEKRPHPGFVILDTPLLTYRDPITSRYGGLSADERKLADTPLKQRFFEHLASLKDVGQFIIFENIELPSDIDKYAHVEVFSGNPLEGRYGLL